MSEVKEHWRYTPGKKVHRVKAHDRNRTMTDKPYKTSKTGIRGIIWDKRCNNWRVGIWRQGKYIFLGRYKDIEEAKAILERFNLTGAKP